MTPPSSSGAAALRQRAAAASLTLAILLAVLKLVAAVATGSLAILSSLIDSLADIVASAITFVAVRISQQPPDRSHRFGHGKAESLSALAQAAAVAGSAVFVLVDAVRRFGAPEPLASDRARRRRDGVRDGRDAGPGHVPAPRRQGHRQPRDQRRQPALPRRPPDQPLGRGCLAPGPAHRAGWIDPVVGTAIALYLGWHAAEIGRQRGSGPDGRGAAARRSGADHGRSSLAHPEVRGVHDLRTRAAGAVRFIELHVELDGEMSVRAAHEVTDAIEARAVRRIPRCRGDPPPGAGGRGGCAPRPPHRRCRFLSRRRSAVAGDRTGQRLGDADRAADGTAELPCVPAPARSSIQVSRWSLAATRSAPAHP